MVDNPDLEPEAEEDEEDAVPCVHPLLDTETRFALCVMFLLCVVFCAIYAVSVAGL